MAFRVDAGNPDVELRWDNTVKYNAGWRMEGRDRTLADTPSLHGSEYKFGKGDMVTNRVDLLTELDLIYRNKYGFRLSGAAWYDAAYDDKVKGNPLYGGASAYPGGRYTRDVKRAYMHSGELLDAFVFGRFDIGNVPINVKAGRHALYWGESLFSPIHGVSYSQSPADFRKAQATPGVEAKELFLPLNQISAQAQITDTVSVAAQYFLEWDSYRFPHGGTYLGSFDALFARGTTLGGLQYDGNRHHGRYKTPGDAGNWGVNVRMAPEWLGGTLGLYYRNFDDKLPTVLLDPVNFHLHNAYAEDVKLFGASLSKEVGGISYGAELVYRKGTALNTGFQPELAIGDTWHALANMVAYIGKTALFDSATFMGELSYSRLDKVRRGTRAYFNHVDYAGCATGDEDDGCSTDDAWGISMSFTPLWYQLLPSTDVSMPISFNTGLSGNSPVPGGGNEGNGSWSIGLSFDYQARYKFDVAYTDYFGDYSSTHTGGVPGKVLNTTNGSNALLNDRGWLSFTFKTTF
nr:DUF1302 domain-containing protein [Thauera linaloolentis]